MGLSPSSGLFATATFRSGREIGGQKRRKEKTAQIEIDLIAKFGSQAIESIEKFGLQTHVNHLARTYCQDRVKQARSYLKSIFDEAIEQEFLVKDPSRTQDSQESSAEGQTDFDLGALAIGLGGGKSAGSNSADAGHDRCAPAQRALRWKSFDDVNTLSITETIYRRKVRPFGKTPGSMTKVHLPDGLAAELTQWKLECPDPSPEAPMFPNADGGFLDPANFRYRVLKLLREALELAKLNFQVLRRTIATRAHSLGSVKDIQSHLRERTPPRTSTSGTSGECAADGRNGLRDAMLTLTATEQQGRVGFEPAKTGAVDASQ